MYHHQGNVGKAFVLGEFSATVSCMRTQNGLCHTIRNLCWIASLDHRTFVPRTYDLADKTDRFVVRSHVCSDVVKRT